MSITGEKDRLQVELWRVAKGIGSLGRPNPEKVSSRVAAQLKELLQYVGELEQQVTALRTADKVTMTREAEVSLAVSVIAHPAGFDLDFAGGAIVIRTTDQATIEVDWEEPGENDKTVTRSQSFPIDNKTEAAEFFVAKRHELQYGLDYESSFVPQSSQLT